MAHLELMGMAPLSQWWHVKTRHSTSHIASVWKGSPDVSVAELILLGTWWRHCLLLIPSVFAKDDPLRVARCRGRPISSFTIERVRDIAAVRGNNGISHHSHTSIFSYFFYLWWWLYCATGYSAVLRLADSPNSWKCFLCKRNYQ